MSDEIQPIGGKTLHGEDENNHDNGMQTLECSVSPDQHNFCKLPSHSLITLGPTGYHTVKLSQTLDGSSSSGWSPSWFSSHLEASSSCAGRSVTAPAAA